jgi:protein-S-isoprenylcysteine O-methyltransferase Ste14
MSAEANPAEPVRPGDPQASRIGGVLTLAYGLLSYGAFLASFLYAIGFIGNWLVPKSIDTGTVRPISQSLLINAALLALFVLQHTIMARPAFKRWWTRIVPTPVERSTFVLLASASLGLIFWQWRPLPQEVWHISGPAGFVLSALSLSGWAVVFIASLTISHLDLFGVRQAWFRFQNLPYAPVGFRLAGLYRIVRHPLMVGFLIAFWVTPRMSVGHLFFAVMTTGYILFGTWIEERDLIAEHGERYLDYKRRVPGLIPLPGRRA